MSCAWKYCIDVRISPTDDSEKRLDATLRELAVAQAYKSEAEIITQELSTQRSRFNDVSMELAECQVALERERLGRTNAAKEKDGLWEVRHYVA